MKTLDLIAENEALKAQVEGYQKRVCSMCDGHGMIGNCLDSIDCPDCVALDNKVKADAIDIFMNELRESGELSGGDMSFVSDFSKEVINDKGWK